MEYVLLTRSRGENHELAKEIKKQGIPSLSSPLLKLHETKGDWSELRGYDYLIITSKFAALLTSRRVLYPAKVLVVGQFSASILAQNPMLKIEAVFEKVEDLKEFLACATLQESILYLSGNIIKAPLPVSVNRRIIYQASYVERFSAAVISKIQQRKIKVVMIYSENSAKTFIKLCLKSDTINCIKNMSFITLSDEIKKVLADYSDNVLRCKKPSNQSMLDSLYKMYD